MIARLRCLCTAAVREATRQFMMSSGSSIMTCIRSNLRHQGLAVLGPCEAQAALKGPTGACAQQQPRMSARPSCQKASRQVSRRASAGGRREYVKVCAHAGWWSSRYTQLLEYLDRMAGGRPTLYRSGFDLS